MLHRFILNIILMAVWIMITFDFSVENMVLGFLLGGVIIFLIRGHFNNDAYLYRIWIFMKLVIFFIYEIIRSSLRVVFLVIFKAKNLNSKIIEYELDIKTNFQMTLLANMITLTPGTLSVDIIDKKIILIHVLEAENPEEVKQSIKEGFEKKIMEIFK